MINKLNITLLFLSLQLSAYAQQMYKLDLKKSKILWDAKNTMGKHYGFILFKSGSINYAANDKPTTATFNLDMNNIKSTDSKTETGKQKVDGQLKTEGFFYVAKYPTATMNVKQITQIGNSTNFKVSGDLTIKGITHPISFNSNINKNGNNISATANLKIDRKKWNINHEPKASSFNFYATIKDKVIADEIDITLNLAFMK
jgi:polyisoprenoid-binding protein YceI